MTTENGTSKQSDFVHLHVHTEYSLLDGSNKIKEYVKRLKELGMDSGAITDHGNMTGAIKFYKACKDAGINPVLGCEVYVSPGSRFEKSGSENDERYYHLILLAENNKGYENLIEIVSTGFLEGFYYKPRVDKEILRKYSEGIICLSACVAGEVAKLIQHGRIEEAEKTALEYQSIYGEGNYYLELQDHGMPEQRLVNMQLLNMSKKYNIPLVATNDCHYTYADDAESHDVLLCIQTGKKVNDADRMRYEGGQFYVKSEEEMKTLFPYALEALSNTHKIAQRCHVELEFGKYHLPKFHTPPEYASDTEYFEYLAKKGFEKRYPKESPEYEEAAKQFPYEIQTIENMGFPAYFLIVQEYINHAKAQGIYVGPGRGSAAGSVVAYCLGITNLCPIKYGLLFERFLNPARVTMPDIDVDFEDSERYRVINHVRELYGEDKVTQIGTIGTMAAKGVIRDVGRALDLEYGYVSRIAKMIPPELNITIEKALKMNPELRTLYETDSVVKQLIDVSLKLEGLPKSAGTHACGVIITENKASTHYPVGLGKEDMPTSEYDMVEIEELGNLKMDFLGLRTLTVLKLAKNSIKKIYDIDVNYDDDSMLNDKETLEMIGKGKTIGTFQLESAGMQSFMKELKPQGFEDIIAGISLYRPGPMDFIPQYVKGKNDSKHIVYDCPQLEEILKPTYGCIVYQEQVMSIVRSLAGFSMARADNIRRAKSKPQQYVIDAERQAFVYGDEKDQVPGCIKNGISESIANKIYDSMVDFAKYAFNKSHAACYAVLSMQTAWLKCHYPAIYMASVMSTVMDKPEKLTPYLLEARDMGIKVLKPDINRSELAFQVEDHSNIRFALAAIKGIGEKVIDEILEEREKSSFKDVADFVQRTYTFVGKGIFEALVKAGAMDEFATRRQLIMVAEMLLTDAKNAQKKQIPGQISLFDMGNEEIEPIRVTLPNCGEFSKEQLLENERDVTGLYISGHPLEDYTNLIKKRGKNVASDFIATEENPEPIVIDGSTTEVGGMLTSINVKYTKNGKQMAFALLEDLTGSIEVVIFPREYEKYHAKVSEDAKAFVKGTVQVEDGVGKLITSEITSFSEIPKSVWIQFQEKDDYFKKEQELHAILNNGGRDRVIIYIKQTQEKCVMKYGTNCQECMDQLINLVGENNVKVI